MLIHSHLPYDHSTSHARVPAGGIHLIASIDSVSEAQVTASFFGSTKALHGENAIPSTETSTHNHSNQQYSITAVTTSTGAIAERYAYSAYGEPTMLDGSGSVLSSSAINNRYTYTGREWDATAGLYHFRARSMSPKTGRFLGRDPIGYIGSLFNLVEYVDSNCLNNVDPSGLCPTPPECPDGKLKMRVCIRCDHGHCWIYTNDPNTGIEHTYGRWMNGYGGVNTSGVNVDVELKAGRGHTSERCTKTCSFNPRISTGYGFYGNNCATYASSIWLSVSGEHLNAVDWYGGDHPDQVCQSISCANGGLPTNCPGGICGPTGGGSSGSSGSSSGSSNGSSSCSSSGGGGSGSCSSIGCLGGSSGSSGGSSGSSGGFF